jgi:spore maturation protein CgeB
MSVKTVFKAKIYGKAFLWYMDPVDGNFNDELIKKAKNASKTFCSIWDSYVELKAHTTNVYFLEEGYDQYQNFPIEMRQNIDVSFIGSLKEHRLDYWRKYNFTIIDGAYGIEHSIAVSKSRINLNFTHGGCSDRVYKILASRGFLLTQPWPDMDKNFRPGEDFEVFSNPEEMVLLIHKYLSDNESRERIANNGSTLSPNKP